MRIGYGRVSTQDQDPEAQHDALQTAGCDEIFIDATSGKLARRPELDKALLSANRAGYQLVVITLDRLGRSLEHLIELAKHLQARGVDLVVLDQGIDTSTAVGRLFFQILGAIAEPRPSTQPSRSACHSRAFPRTCQPHRALRRKSLPSSPSGRSDRTSRRGWGLQDETMSSDRTSGSA